MALLPMTVILMVPTLTGHTGLTFTDRRTILDRPCSSDSAFAANANGIIAAMVTGATAAEVTAVGIDAADVEAVQ